MSVNPGEFINQIPKDKLSEIVNAFTAETTAQQAIEALAAAGVEASAEEAQALLESLVGEAGEGEEILDEVLEAVSGGYEEGECGWCEY
jgi:hypothetical protein